MNGPDEPRDGWLKKALDHAPDAPVPPALREAILQASRAPRAAEPAAPWWSRLSAWLVRPQVAAGLASVAMVTVAGLLWHDEPLPEMPPSPAPAAERSAPAPAPSADRAEAEVAAPQVKARAAAPQEMKAAPPEPARRAAVRREEAPVPSGSVVPKPAAAPAPAPTPAPAPAAVAEESAAAPPAAAMAPPPPAPVVVAQDKEKRVQAADAAATAKAAPLRSAAPAGALSRAFAPGAATLAEVRAALAAAPSRWTWERETGGSHPADAPLSDWLALLDATATSSWRPANTQRTGAAELRLVFDGRTVHRWWLTDDAVVWLSPAGLQQAPLDGAAARRLLEALPPTPP